MLAQRMKTKMTKKKSYIYLLHHKHCLRETISRPTENLHRPLVLQQASYSSIKKLIGSYHHYHVDHMHSWPTFEPSSLQLVWFQIHFEPLKDDIKKETKSLRWDITKTEYRSVYLLFNKKSLPTSTKNDRQELVFVQHPFRNKASHYIAQVNDK